MFTHLSSPHAFTITPDLPRSLELCKKCSGINHLLDAHKCITVIILSMESASSGVPDTSEEAPGTADAAVVSALSAVDSRLAAGNAAASAEAAAPRSEGSAESALVTLLGTASKPAICGVQTSLQAALVHAMLHAAVCSFIRCTPSGRERSSQHGGGDPQISGRRAERARHAAEHCQQACNLRAHKLCSQQGCMLCFMRWCAAGNTAGAEAARSRSVGSAQSGFSPRCWAPPAGLQPAAAALQSALVQARVPASMSVVVHVGRLILQARWPRWATLAHPRSAAHRSCCQQQCLDSARRWMLWCNLVFSTQLQSPPCQCSDSCMFVNAGSDQQGVAYARASRCLQSYVGGPLLTCGDAPQHRSD